MTSRVLPERDEASASYSAPYFGGCAVLTNDPA
jgi:hypothetical protein